MRISTYRSWLLGAVSGEQLAIAIAIGGAITLFAIYGQSFDQENGFTENKV
jgi:hypothetical protein